MPQAAEGQPDVTMEELSRLAGASRRRVLKQRLRGAAACHLDWSTSEEAKAVVPANGAGMRRWRTGLAGRKDELVRRSNRRVKLPPAAEHERPPARVREARGTRGCS